MGSPMGHTEENMAGSGYTLPLKIQHRNKTWRPGNFSVTLVQSD
jgi:hypothetical protein